MNKVIAIGALGGSGTRAVAQILMEAGVYMGSEFSQQKDNVLFTRMFRNPEWFKKASAKDIDFRIQVFDKIMSGKTLGITEVNELNIAIKTNPTYPTSHKARRQFIFDHYTKTRKSNSTWGFKEPNSHMYLPHLDGYFKEFKYVHVLRHGLDMAFARNLKQLHNWGPHFGIDASEKLSSKKTARLQLDYWIAATNATVEAGKKMGDRFLLVKHQDIYTNPKDFVQTLFHFLGLPVSDDVKKTLAKIPKVPETKGRYKEHDLSIFKPSQIEAVKEFGFEI